MENLERSPGLEQKDQGENRIMIEVEHRGSLQSAEGFVDHFTKDLDFHPKSSGMSLKGYLMRSDLHVLKIPLIAIEQAE